MIDDKGAACAGDETKWDHGSDERFTQYYAEASLSEETIERSRILMEKILSFLPPGQRERRLRVADIGCGPGSQATVWAQAGHDISGVDINEELIRIARERAREQGLPIEYFVGTATELPWDDASVDVCLLPELLEHVAEWQACLDEAARIMKPGGTLYLSTSNKLCPVQHEFDLPLYSWYPARLKRHYERVSVTTRPELVNYASYPAVNWFSYYSLKKELGRRGMSVMDKFDFNAVISPPGLRRNIFKTITALPPLRLAAHMATPYTIVVATKH